MLIPHHFPRSQRWRERRQRFVPNSTVIDPREFAVDVLPRPAEVKAFLARHHYLGTLPVARLAVGLFRNGAAGRSELAGVSVFSVPMNPASVRLHAGLDEARAGVDLGRLVLLDDVAANGETFFIRRSFRLLRQTLPEVEAVIAYSDPMPRPGPHGTFLGGHVGLAYQAANAAAFRGRRPPRIEHFTPDGATFSARNVSKIRSGDNGWQYAVYELIRRGAPAPPTDDLRAWYADLIARGFIRKRRHPGVYAYSFALTQRARARARRFPRLDPPRKAAQPIGCDVTALPLFSSIS